MRSLEKVYSSFSRVLPAHLTHYLSPLKSRWSVDTPLLRSKYFTSHALHNKKDEVVSSAESEDESKSKDPLIHPSAVQQPVLWKAIASEDGSRLDRFIKRRAPGLPQGFIQRLIRRRRIIVNSESANRNAYPIYTNDVVRLPGDIKLGLSRGKRKPPPDDVSLAESEMVRGWVLFRDARCAVLNKPAGLATQGGGPVGERHIEALLPGLGLGRYWLIHRLDREVGGALLIARDVGAAGLLAEHFRARRIRKRYWALVEGTPSEKKGLIDYEIDGKNARTAYRVVEMIDDHFTWLELEPRTGRKHQLRIHCAEILQTPLVGDIRYGSSPHGLNIISGIENHSPGLHLMAREIAFPKLTQNQSGGGKRARGPRGNDSNLVAITAPLPPHMANTWKRLGLDEKLV